MIQLGLESADQPEVVALFRLADAASLALYPGEARTGLPPGALLAQGVRFIVARQDGTAIGCGGLVPVDERTAELKRLFVHPDARGHGVGQALVTALEQLARRGGFGSLRLETGMRAGAAITLYRRAGYRDVAPFGEHADDPSSRFMEKSLGLPPPIR